MKRFFYCILTVVAVMSCLATATTAQTTVTYYITREEMPDMRIFLPAPPDTTSEAFAHDVMRYFWGKQMRQDPVRGPIAAADADWSTEYVCKVMSEPFGMQISPEATPEIFKLVNNSAGTADLIGKTPKAYYMRKRPFDRFKEPSLVPKDDEALSHNGSYPSGHTIRGWSAALVLAEVNPARASEILARGFMYGDSRVIVGAHWQSDVDAGRLCASAAVTMLHTSPAFQEQMAKAKAEFQRLSNK